MPLYSSFSAKPAPKKADFNTGIADDKLNREIYGDSGFDELNDALAMLNSIANMTF